jgi:hypothetical protein
MPPPQSDKQGPEQAVQMIQDGFNMLGQMLQQAGQSLPPEDVQLFQAAQQATDTFIQSLSGPANSAPQGKPQPSGPMAENQSAKSQPMSPGSR